MPEASYQARDFSRLIGIEGLSETALRTHFTLYQGYVTNTNRLMDTLSAMNQAGTTGTPEYAELKRRFGFEWNGIRLHELYFENLGPAARNLDSRLTQIMVAEWGSYEDWERAFRAVGAMRGVGWVVLYYDAAIDRLFNAWINEHHVGHLAGATPLLVMDVWEHAFMLDYGTRRADYISAFINNINWPAVEARLR